MNQIELRKLIMIRRHRAVVNGLSRATREQLQRLMCLPTRPRTPLYDVLVDALVMHVDLVHALLHLDTEESRSAVGELVGRPVLTGHPALGRARLPIPVLRITRKGDARRVLVVSPRADWTRLDGGRTLERADMYRRLGSIRVGQSLEQVLARGVTRRDLRTATRRGWLKLETQS